MINLNEIYVVDSITGENVPLGDILLQMEDRLERLEEENIATTNNLYEIMNDLEGLERRVDS